MDQLASMFEITTMANEILRINASEDVSHCPLLIALAVTPDGNFYEIWDKCVGPHSVSNKKCGD